MLNISANSNTIFKNLVLQALGTIWFRLLQKKYIKKFHACVPLTKIIVQTFERFLVLSSNCIFLNLLRLAYDKRFRKTTVTFRYCITIYWNIMYILNRLHPIHNYVEASTTNYFL